MEPENLWTPPADVLDTTRIGDYVRFLARSRNLSFDSYELLWRWSVEEIEDFWDSIREYFGLVFHETGEKHPLTAIVLVQ